ncbi:MAG: putative glycoside hydrolase [archaeon]
MYKASNSYLKIHAWFPVFKDPYAVEEAGGPKLAAQKAKKGLLTETRDHLLNPWDRGSTDTIPIYDNKLSDPTNPRYFADPANPDVVRYELSLLEEIVRKYTPDGINLDYIRYTDKEYVPGGYTLIITQGAITDFVRQVRSKFGSKPELSADVFPSDQRPVRGQDLDHFAQYLDVIIPMEYADLTIEKPAEIGQETLSLRRKFPGKYVITALKGWKGGEQNLQDFFLELRDGIRKSLGAGASGYAIFTYESLLTGSGSGSLNKVEQNIKEVNVK